MRSCELPGGGAMPVLGLGTWRMGESAGRKSREVAALRSAIAMGYRLFDTAEMYGEGGAETVLGAAIAQAVGAGEVRREDLFVVSKVYPHNASRAGTVAACERSLARLGLERIDLYLLHWRGQHRLAETCAAMRALVQAGRIGRWGVSNFDVDDLQELQAVQDALGPGPAELACASNQVYYSLRARGVEFSLLPWQRKHAMPLMAYSPIDQGALAEQAVLRDIGARCGASAAQVALAWLLRQSGVVAIPKAAREDHLRENLAALQIELSAQELARLDREFPAPRRKGPLQML
jgi:diketogulonate reductase-like aldo/keto reductase